MGCETIGSVLSREGEQFKLLAMTVRLAGTDNLGHFGCGYMKEGGYSLQQQPDEFAAAIIVLDELVHGGAYLEIGSASGGACRFLHEYLRFSRVHVIDDRSHARWREQDAHFAAMSVPPRLYIGDSHSPSAAAWVAENAPYDLAFIDGDHSYTGCQADFDVVRSHARFVMFHDIVACEGVKRVWEDAVALGRLEPIAALVGAERPLGIGIGRVVR